MILIKRSENLPSFLYIGKPLPLILNTFPLGVPFGIVKVNKISFGIIKEKEINKKSLEN